MPKYFAVTTVILALATSSCAVLFGEKGEPKPPHALSEPVLPPLPPEPLLVESGALFAYVVDGQTQSSLPEAGSQVYALTVNGTSVRLRAPTGWTASDSGALWMQDQLDPSVRFVVYPTKELEKTFRGDWFERVVSEPSETRSEVRSLSSARQPSLFTYCRSDGRCGIVYALLTTAGDPSSGVIVHGSWPERQDRTLRPLIVAIANGITLSAASKPASAGD